MGNQWIWWLHYVETHHFCCFPYPLLQFFIKISWQPHGHPQHINEQSSLLAKSGEANENARVPSISPVPWHFFHQWKNTNGLAEHLYGTLWIERPNYMTSLHTSLTKTSTKKCLLINTPNKQTNMWTLPSTFCLADQVAQQWWSTFRTSPPASSLPQLQCQPRHYR